MARENREAPLGSVNHPYFIWMGDVVPLGSRAQNVSSSTARRPRPFGRIFERYLVLGAPIQPLSEWNAKGIVTRPRALQTGQTFGGVPFTRGPLGNLRKSRIYIGEISFSAPSKPRWPRTLAAPTQIRCSTS
ncbi:MAG: hypothetical protein JO261_04615 [Alphaproteobacteria bacterium]|nr:hypothetical protein [Alphaproteobacteria bacterium]MBV9692963.1 hypothetical protein [Alphaproteobacteria bacterium]